MHLKTVKTTEQKRNTENPIDVNTSTKIFYQTTEDAAKNEFAGNLTDITTHLALIDTEYYTQMKNEYSFFSFFFLTC